MERLANAGDNNMFYDKQPSEQRENYKHMLALIGSLSNLFADSDKPMLYYRAHENAFCRYFEAENLSREDCSADAMKGHVGIGLKTWVGNDDQKVAEFGKLRPDYENLSGLELVRKIASYRNERIRVTKKMHGIHEMFYHIVKRVPHGMQIYEAAFDEIDIDSIKLDKKRGNANNTYFTDGRHTYHFSMSKNTLFMIFDGMEMLDAFDVSIIEDPFEALKKLDAAMQDAPATVHQEEKTFTDTRPRLCLRLYSVKKEEDKEQEEEKHKTRKKEIRKKIKCVNERSGINQWNAGGRKRHPDELYIPYPSEDRKRDKHFFPPRDESFIIILPDGKKMEAKVCQDGGKAIMSNPNKELGKWLLRDVFGLPERTVVTYDMLKVFNVDSVMFTRIQDANNGNKAVYEIDFCPLGTYEKMYNLPDIDNLDDN